jgi:SAM-dependent methyltransferase
MARYYDRLYEWKDSAGEMERLVELMGLPADGTLSLLDVACGTGRCLELLAARFRAEGLDSSPEMLEVARERHPGLVFHLGDMTDFDLGRTYDAVTCLLSSIGYVVTVERLRAAAACMARHVAPGGVLAVEPWMTPENWRPGTVHATLVDDPELKIARVSTSLTREGCSVVDLHHLVGTPEGTGHFVEQHVMGLFSVEEMTAALEGAGLAVTYDAYGITGRGLYVGRMEQSRPGSRV